MTQFMAFVFLFLCTGCGGKQSPVHGVDGIDGRDGNDSVYRIIDPCGDSMGVDEILFVLVSGEIVAWYEGVGLVVLKPGIYRTTDDQLCQFEITVDNEYREL